MTAIMTPTITMIQTSDSSRIPTKYLRLIVSLFPCRFEVDQLPGHLGLLLLQVFYLEVKVRKLLVDPVKARPYHSE